MKKLFLLLTCFFISVGLAMAQTTPISGVVVDEKGESVIGASVIVKGTTTGTTTDVNGKFSLEVPTTNKILVVTYIGMDQKEVEATPNMTITLTSSATQLDEVMVVAYGTTKKSSFTGSAASIKGEKIALQQSSNVSKSLEGAVAGVQVSSSSGQPGSSAAIRIRGIGSISGSSSPLIVVDGVPYEGSLNSINNQDIETISVLKDAAANSLYGSRGANGVILITTKKGKSGKVSVSFENRTGFNYMGVPPYEVLDSPKEYYELYWEALRNQQVYGGSGTNPIAAGQLASNELITALGYNNYDVDNKKLIDPITGKLNPSAKLMYHDDWFKEAFRPGLREENNISVSGGTEKTKYYASLNYLYDDSYTEKSTLKRISARMNLDQELNSWFRIGFNMAFANVETDAPNVGGTNYSSIFYIGKNLAPIYPVYMYDKEGKRVMDKNGNSVYDFGTTMGKRPVGANSNAIATQVLDIRGTTVDAVNAKVFAEFKFLKDFTLTLNGSVDNFNTSEIVFQTPVDGDAKNVGGRSTKEMTRYYVLNANQLLNWSREFNENQIDVLLGHETKRDHVSFLWAQKENFVVPDNPELANGAKLIDASSSASEYALEGYFGQVKFDHDEKYYFSTSLRRDACSRFSPETRWGTFWSLGGAWRIKQESFLIDREWLDDLKVRASYGEQGNDNIGNSEGYHDQYEVVNQDGVAGLNYIFRGNPNLTWEKNRNFNAGFDFKIYDKLAGTIEYFTRESSDLLYMKPLPPSDGRPGSIWENSMGMVNKGIEMELVWDIINTNDLKWNFSVNATHYKNEITKLPPDRPNTGWAVTNYYYKIGSSIYDWYTYKFEGVNPANGDPLYLADVKDASGNIISTKTVNKTSEATRYETGKSAIPDLYGGFSTFLDFKGFDLSLSAAYEIGGYSLDSQYSGFMHGGTSGNNWHKDVYNRWTPDNKGSNIPRIQVGYQDINGSSDRFLIERTHLSLKNAVLGYSLPKSTLSKIGLEKLRFFVVGDNLWLFSKRQGFDPRQSFSGGTGYAYSAMRTLSVGFNLNF